MKRIFLLDGHPDPSPERFCAALADAYADGARRSGHEVRRLDLGTMAIPVLRSRDDFVKGPLAADAAHVQDAISWAEHIVVIHPLWLGGQPALLRALFEQVFRYGFVRAEPGNRRSQKKLTGRTAHVVATMRMPAFLYRWQQGAFGVRALEESLVHYAGVRPVCRTLIGSVDDLSDARRRQWLRRLQEAGAAGR